MNHKNRNEVSYYPEIMSFLETQIKSNFKANYNKDLEVYCRIGELSTQLKELVNEYPEKFACIKDYANSVPPLNLDIFAVITDTVKFEILILEIKLLKSVGLNQWSQLVGYCIVSGAKYGLLINVDNGPSSRLEYLLKSDENISKISRITYENQIDHQFGLMIWNPLTYNVEYSNLGALGSISALCEMLAESFV